MTMGKHRNKSLNAGILKISGLFGGLQITNILCSIIRSKLVAIWIGASGMGLFGIFNTTVEMIASLSMFGLRESAVRNIACTTPSEKPRMVKVIRRCATALGIVGMLLTLACSTLLSNISFGNTSYFWAFMLLSTIVYTSVTNGGEGAIFQGLQRYRKLATCSMIGTVGGLAVSIPMFYFWRIDSIIPSIMSYGIITWLAMGAYRERIGSPCEPVSIGETIEIGRKILSLGFYLTVTGFVANAISYAMMAFLNNRYGTDTAGYYQAGFTLVNRYIGLVLTAISMEYYPRLSSVAGHNKRISTYVSNQLFMAMALLVPIILMFICCSELIIKLFYSSEFIIIMPFIICAVVGTIFRGISWCMAFVILARGDGRTYLITETSSALLSVAFNIILFQLCGFQGLGIAYILWYICYTIIVGTVYFKRYRMKISRNFYAFGIYSIMICAAGGAIALTLSPYLVIPLAIIATVVSFKALKRKIA